MFLCYVVFNEKVRNHWLGKFGLRTNSPATSTVQMPNIQRHNKAGKEEEKEDDIKANPSAGKEEGSEIPHTDDVAEINKLHEPDNVEERHYDTANDCTDFY